MANNNYVWPEFYMKFADKLLEYKDNRQTLVDKIYKVFDENDLNLFHLKE